MFTVPGGERGTGGITIPGRGRGPCPTDLHLPVGQGPRPLPGNADAPRWVSPLLLLVLLALTVSPIHARQDPPAKPAEDKKAAKPLPPDTAEPGAVPDFGTAHFGGVAFIKIPAGTFRRGTTDAQRAALEAAGMWNSLDSVEQPAREIRITKPFFLSQTEVTQAQWKKVMGSDPKLNPSAFKTSDDLPVDSVSWNLAQDFLTKFGAAAGKGRFRLPTEAEWEYACRAGSDDVFGMGQDKKPITTETLPEYAWFSANADTRTQPVGQKKPNAWGLHDLHGNVWEWCQDSYSPTFYATGPAADPLYNGSATEHVLRGGCWFLEARSLRAAVRGGGLPDFKSQYVGLRIVREM